MAYRELAPPPPWRSTLSCLWVRTAGRGEPPVRVLPDAGVDLIWSSQRGAFVAGPDTSAKVAVLAPGAVLAGARFRPGAAGVALGVPMAELLDLRVDAADLDPRLDVAAQTPAEALRALLAVIEPRGADAAVAAAARTGEGVAAAARAVGLSERQLRRRSLHALGYGPKTLARILRFQRFVALADAAAEIPLAALAVDAGYADQPHLTRECTRLAGLPPAALRRERGGSAPGPSARQASTARRPL